MSDKVKYPTFARTKPAASQISASVVCILKKFNWKKVTFIHTANDENGWPVTVATVESVSVFSAYRQSITANKLLFVQKKYLRLCEITSLSLIFVFTDKFPPLCIYYVYIKIYVSCDIFKLS